MATEIDSLQIEINASATKANDAIDKLVKKLDLLSDSLGKINSSGLSGLASGVQSLGTAMQSLRNVRSNEFTRLANNIERLSRIDVSSLNNTASTISNLTNAFSGINAITVNSQQLGTLSTNLSTLSRGIRSFGNINSSNLSSIAATLTPLANGITVLGNVNFNNRNLQNLINSLTRLSNANVSGLSNINFSQLGNSIGQLATSLQDAPHIHQSIISMTNAISNLSESGQNISVVSANLTGLGNSLRRFMSDMALAPSVSNNTISFSQAIATLANAGNRAGATASNLSVLGSGLRDLIITLSTAPNVSRNIIDLTNALAKLSRTGSSSGKAVNSLNNVMDSYSRKVQNSSVKTTNLLSSLGKVTAIYYTLKNLASGFTESIDIASSLTEAQNVVDTTFGSYANLVEEMSKTSIGDFGMSELTVKKVSSRFQAMGTAVGIAQGKMADMSLELTKLTGDMASFYNISQEDMATSLQSVFTGETEPLRKYGLDLTQATLQEWAMKQGIDANISSMSQMEKVLLRYQYVMANTKTAQGDFAKTAGTWANQIRILQESFKALGGIVGQVLINVFKPFISAMNVMMQQVINFARVISNALGKIFGWTYEESSGGIASDFEIAADATGDIASNMANAQKSAQKMKNSVRIFDELKTINLNDSDSGSGSGANGIGTASSPNGQWTQTESILKEFESDIDNLFELGKHINETLTNALRNIDWESVYEGARNFGKGLADFLNGLISPELFSELGKTIAGSINTAIYSVLSFGKNFDWVNLGSSLAEGLTSFFEELDTASLGEMITTWVRGVLATWSTFLNKTDFKLIGEKIGELLKEIDIVGLAEDFADVLWEALKSAFELLKGMIDVAPLETAIVASLAGMKFFGLGSKISGALKKAIFGEVSTTGTAQATGRSIGSKIFSSLSSTWTSLGGLGGILTTDLGTIMASGSAGAIGMTIGTGIIGGVAAGFAGFEAGKAIGKLFNTKDFEEYYDNFKFFGDGGFFDEISDDWGITLEALDTMIQEKTSPKYVLPAEKEWDKLKEVTNDGMKDINSIVKKKSLNLKGTWSSTFSTMGNTLEKGMNLFNSKLTMKTSAMQAIWEGNNTFIKKSLNDTIDETSKVLVNGLNSMSMQIGNGTSSMISKISESAVKMGSEVASQVGNIKTTMESTKSSMESLWLSTTESINKGITTSVRSMLVKTTGGLNGIIEGFEGLIRAISLGTNSLIAGVNASLGRFTSSPVKSFNPLLNIGRLTVPSFETGGYIPKSYSMFMAGENGIPEIMGTVGGKSAVAGGVEITGIKDAIYSTSQQEVQLMREQNSLLRALLEKETGISEDAIFRSVKKSASDYTKRTGRPAF